MRYCVLRLRICWLRFAFIAVFPWTCISAEFQLRWALAQNRNKLLLRIATNCYHIATNSYQLLSSSKYVSTHFSWFLSYHTKDRRNIKSCHNHLSTTMIEYSLIYNFTKKNFVVKGSKWIYLCYTKKFYYKYVYRIVAY